MNYGLVFGRPRREGIGNTELEDRLNEGVRLLKHGIVDKLILSGGISHYTETNSIPEAEHSKKYLITQGIKEDQLLLETQAKESIGNLLFSIELAKNIDTLYLISNDHHIFRIMQYCSLMGEVEFNYIFVGVHSKIKLTTETGIDRDNLEQRSYLYANTVFRGCNSIQSFKERLLSQYFAYNPDSKLTKDIVQAYHRGDIEIGVIEDIIHNP